VHLSADTSSTKIPLNTTQAEYPSIQNATCIYDTTTGAVSCIATSGVSTGFSNVQKQFTSTKPTNGKLIGTYTDPATQSTVYVFALAPASLISQAQAAQEIARATAEKIFNPIKGGSKPTPNPYSTISLNQAGIDALYGSSGFKVDGALLTYIKNFYFYLEYLVKLEYAARLLNYAESLKLDILTIIEKNDWPGLVQAAQQKAGGWNALKKALFASTVSPDWDGLRGLIKADSWQSLVKTPFWTSFPGLTPADFEQTAIWQSYIQYTVARSFVQDENILLMLKELKEAIFKYIPNIEVAYYHPDFTNLRQGYELFHLHMILNENKRSRLLSQSPWSTVMGKNGSYDLLSIYKAAQTFIQTPLYRYAAQAQNDPSFALSSVAQNKISANAKDFVDDPILQEKLTLIGMIANLQALLQPYFEKNTLDTTLPLLTKSGAVTPSILPYEAPDGLYLTDLAHLNDALISNNSPQKNQQQAFLKLTPPDTETLVVAQSFWSKAWHAFKGGMKKAWHGLEEAGKDLVNAGIEFGKLVAQSLTVAGDVLNPVNLIQIINDSGNARDKLLNDFATLREHAGKEIEAATKGMGQVVGDLKDAADAAITGVQDSSKALLQGIGDFVEKGCNLITGNLDNELCGDINQAFVTVVSTVIDKIATDAKTMVAVSAGALQLTAAGAAIIADGATELVTGDIKDMPDTLLHDLKRLGKAAAAAVLAPLTLQLKMIEENLINALKLAQYVISVITRLFIDAVSAVVLAGAMAFDPGDALDVAESVRTALNEHERVINAVVTTAILLATVPLTGGSSLPLVAIAVGLTVGPQIISIYGSYQEDELEKARKEDEEAFLDHFRTHIERSKIVYKQQQDAWAQEMTLKYQAQTDNQERGLGFYKNFMDANFEAFKLQMAQTLGSYVAPQLKPDAYGMIPADVGTIYGINTGVYNLNASQGFALFSKARNSFSQEIAVSPALISQASDSPLGTVETKNWFNQKEIMPLSTPLTQIELRFQGIYLLNTFHTGIYLGTQKLDLNTITTSQTMPLALDHFAKMAVFKRDNAQSPIVFGFYEHDGVGWAPTTIVAPQFVTGTWYHIKLQVQNKAVGIKIWAEPDTEPTTWQQVAVQDSSPALTVAAVSSGAAIEYQWIQPAQAVKVNTTLRPPSKMCIIPCDQTTCSPITCQKIPISVEKDREVGALYRLQSLRSPSLGTLSLQSTGDTQLIKHQYIYTTKSTKLSDQRGAILSDYVICAVQQETATGNTVTKLGHIPSQSNCIVSLISGKTYDQNGTDLGIRVGGVLDTYRTTHGPLTTDLEKTISDAQNIYLQASKQVSLGKFTLAIADTALLPRYQFIYTMPLKGSDGAQLKTAASTPLNDYVVLVTVASDGSYDSVGASINDTWQDTKKSWGVLSIVSGNLYNAQSTTPIVTGYIPEDILANYQDAHGSLPTTLVTAITQAQQAYTQSTQVTANKQPAKDKNSTDQANQSSMSNQQDTGQSTGLTPLKPPPPASNSMQQKSDDASDGDFDFSTG
jgi:hypothetical protein